MPLGRSTAAAVHDQAIRPVITSVVSQTAFYRQAAAVLLDPGSTEQVHFEACHAGTSSPLISYTQILLRVPPSLRTRRLFVEVLHSLAFPV
jgi:hypothetical protein